MITDVSVVRTYFAKLGLEAEIADIYLALHAHGPQSIAALARNSGVERTRIYRLIDKLMDSNLVEIETQSKRGIIKAAPIANLTILIKAREQELRSLHDELGLIEQVLARTSVSDSTTRVQLYKGYEGYKQMLWNETGATSDVLALLHENMQAKTKHAFLDEWITRSNQHSIHYTCIGDDTFFKSTQNASNEAKLPEHWQIKHISPDVFTIPVTCVVYDDVIAYYTWKDDDIFGIELYNKAAATMQRQLCMLIWDKASPYSG